MKNIPTTTAQAAIIITPEYLATLHEAENNAKRLRHLLTELITMYPHLVAALSNPEPHE